jgi:hypothetical protein
MPFPWLHPSIPADYRKTFAREAEAATLQELEERAALLCRLRYRKADAAARLRASLRWEYELHRTPKLIDRVDAIVDAVYARGGRAGGAPEP